MTAVITGADNQLTAVVARAVMGDEIAFAQIIRANHDVMTRVCFLACGDLDLADEAVQAAWTVAWAKLGTLRDASRLRPWLVSVAANEARQLLRRRRRRVVVELQMARAGADDPDPAGSVQDIDLANALARLDPDDRALLAMRYVAGFNSSELAIATGRSASGTRARFARLLSRLRTELADV